MARHRIRKINKKNKNKGKGRHAYMAWVRSHIGK